MKTRKKKTTPKKKNNPTPNIKIDTLVIDKRTAYHNIPVNDLYFFLCVICKEVKTLDIYDQKGLIAQNIHPFCKKIEQKIRQYEGKKKIKLLENKTSIYLPIPNKSTSRTKKEKEDDSFTFLSKESVDKKPVEMISFNLRRRNQIKWHTTQVDLKKSALEEHSESRAHKHLDPQTSGITLNNLCKVLHMHKARYNIWKQSNYLKYPKKIILKQGGNKKISLSLKTNGSKYKENGTPLRFRTNSYEFGVFIEEKKDFPNVNVQIYCEPKRRTSANNLWSQLDKAKENNKTYQKLNTAYGLKIIDGNMVTHYLRYDNEKKCWENLTKKSIVFKKSPKMHEVFEKRKEEDQFKNIKVQLPALDDNLFTEKAYKGGLDELARKRRKKKKKIRKNPIPDFDNIFDEKEKKQAYKRTPTIQPTNISFTPEDMMDIEKEIEKEIEKIESTDLSSQHQKETLEDMIDRPIKRKKKSKKKEEEESPKSSTKDPGFFGSSPASSSSKSTTRKKKKRKKTKYTTKKIQRYIINGQWSPLQEALKNPSEIAFTDENSCDERARLLHLLLLRKDKPDTSTYGNLITSIVNLYKNNGLGVNVIQLIDRTYYTTLHAAIDGECDPEIVLLLISLAQPTQKTSSNYNKEKNLFYKHRTYSSTAKHLQSSCTLHKKLGGTILHHIAQKIGTHQRNTIMLNKLADIYNLLMRFLLEKEDLKIPYSGDDKTRAGDMLLKTELSSLIARLKETKWKNWKEMLPPTPGLKRKSAKNGGYSGGFTFSYLSTDDPPDDNPDGDNDFSGNGGNSAPKNKVI